MPTLERIDDAQGSVILGWLDPPVLYARFSRSVSVELAQRFARRFGRVIGDSVAVRYFCDYSELDSYDLAAFKVMFEALLAKGDQFQLITMRPWASPPRPHVRAMLDSLICIEYVTSAETFNERLNAAAPAATAAGITTLIPAPEPHFHATRTPVPPNSLAAPPPDVAPLGYTYVFQLDDFERGEFIAARYAYLAARPRGAWVCMARSDEQALAMARQAALLEWAAPCQRSAQWTVPGSAKRIR